MTTENLPLTASVTIGMPVGKPIPVQTVVSLYATAEQMGKMGIRCELAMLQCGVIQIARDSVLDEFLRNDTDKLFWIDSDMVWTPGDFLRLLGLATKFDIVGAAYPVKIDGPMVFHINSEACELTTNDYGLLPMNGMGLGFSIMSRRACEAVAATKPRVIENGREMAEVFRVDKSPTGHRRTEDIAFFLDLKAAGFEVWCDPSIELGHVGDREWRGKLFDAFPQRPSGLILNLEES